MYSEADLQQQVADHLRLQYPDVLFHSDFGSGVKLTMGQAAKQKRQNGGRRAWPDMFVAAPSAVWNNRMSEDDEHWTKMPYLGLFIELKRAGVRLKKKDGSWATPHIAEQADTLMRLRAEGYYAEFACGFDEAKNLIDLYLKGEINEWN